MTGLPGGRGQEGLGRVWVTGWIRPGYGNGVKGL